MHLILLHIVMLHPDFIKRTRMLLKEEYGAFETMLILSEAPISIRLNPCKDTIDTEEDYQFSIAPHNVEQLVPWCKTGCYLKMRPSFTYEPMFHAGTYYVQEASSMFLEQAVKTVLQKTGASPINVLDLCAAPGGKSTHLLALLPENGLLVSNEVIRSRSMILAENITKWGVPNTIVTQNDPKDFGKLTRFFDLIVADLPCSGEGMFRKDRASRSEWSLDNVKLCASRQRRIVRDVWDALKPGGWLIYSTCTFNTEENEDNVQSLAEELGAKVILIPTEKEWNIAGALKHNLPAYRFFPHRTAGEGFFLALMQKEDSAPEQTAATMQTVATKQTVGTKQTIGTKQSIGAKSNKQRPAVPEQIRNLLLQPEDFSFFTAGKSATQIHAIPEIHAKNRALLSERLHIISAGVRLGEFKGADFIPDISLALSTKLNPRAFPTVELSYEQAIAYLERETITVPESTPKGHLLVTFRNTPLGFVKNIGARTNNLYPREWRIRNRTKNPFNR